MIQLLLSPAKPESHRAHLQRRSSLLLDTETQEQISVVLHTRERFSAALHSIGHLFETDR